MHYDHTQHVPLCRLLVAVGLSMLVGAASTPVPAVQVVLFVSGGLVLVLAASFGHLTVRDEGDRLLVEFGPLPLFRRLVLDSDVEQVERGRTTVLDGWGVHLSPWAAGRGTCGASTAWICPSPMAADCGSAPTTQKGWRASLRSGSRAADDGRRGRSASSSSGC